MAIKINIGALKEGEHSIEFTCDAKELGIEEKILKNHIFINANLFKTSNQLDIKIALKGTFSFICDRCLEIFDYPFQNTFELVYVQKSDVRDSFDDDYLKTYNPHMKTIDITKDISEYVLLSIPLRKMPAQSENGSCSWCNKKPEYWKQYFS